MRILITGITGMVGSHLADHLLESQTDVEVHGLVRWRSPLDNLAAALGRVHLHHGDLRDLNSLIGVMGAARPERIFHLAAQSFVPSSFTAPADTIQTNVVGTVNLLDAVRIAGLDPLIHVCSSSEVYGQVREDELPIKETNPFRPASPYAVSKAGADMIADQYFRSHGVRTVRTRMFTHTGPRRGPVFAESAFAGQIAAIERGLQSGPVRVGNLDSVRTVADVRDTVKAYWLLLEKSPPGAVYNVGGTRAVTIGEILEILKSLARVAITHQVDDALLRPLDVTLQVPDVSAFKAATGWEPEIPLERTLADLLDYHRRRLGTAP